MKQAKRKKLTQREIKDRAEARAWARANGILPPVKQRLNRKKFVNEAIAEFEALDVYTADYYLRKAIGCMVGPDMPAVTQEAVGVAKVLKIAAATARFMDKLKEENNRTYTIGEYVEDVVLPITRL